MMKQFLSPGQGKGDRLPFQKDKKGPCGRASTFDCGFDALSCQEKMGKYFIQYLKDAIMGMGIFLYPFAQESD